MPLFRGVRHAVEDKVQDMLVGEKVDEVLSVAPTGDKIVVAENAKPLGDDRYRLTLQRRQLCHTSRALCQMGYQPNARRIAKRAEKTRRLLDGNRIDGQLQSLWV